MNNKTFLENLLKEINEDNVILEAPELVKNPLNRNNNQTDVPEPDDDNNNDTGDAGDNNTDDNAQDNNADNGADVPEPDDPDAAGDDAAGDGDAAGGDLEPDDMDGDTSDGADTTTSDGVTDDSSSTDQTTDKDTEEIKTLNGLLFNQLSPEQKKIADLELKGQFIELFEKINEFKLKVDNLERNDDNSKVLNRVSNALMQLSNLIKSYVQFTYQTKTYIENKSELFYSIWTLDKVVKLFDTVCPKDA